MGCPKTSSIEAAKSLRISVHCWAGAEGSQGSGERGSIFVPGFRVMHGFLEGAGGKRRTVGKATDVQVNQLSCVRSGRLYVLGV